MKKFLCIFFIAFIVISSPIFTAKQYVFAETLNEQTVIEEELDKEINQQLGDLDISGVDEMFDEITKDSIFTDKSFLENLKEIINGNLSVDANSFIDYILNVFLQDILDFLPYVCLIVAIAILYSIVSGIRADSKNKSIGDIVHFVCYGSIIVIVVAGFSNLVGITSGTLETIKSLMELIFPILLTLLTAVGGSVSVGVYQPAMAMLSGTAISIFTSVLLPIFSFKLVFTIISNLTTNIKFDKFIEFFNSSFKWILGIVLTIFTAFVSIQGIMAGSVDSISLRTAKYTIKGAVPIVGGFISDGVGLIMASSVLIKNAVGVCGLVMLFLTIVLPVVKIIVFSFLLKLASAIIEPIADGRVTTFISSISKLISQLVALLLGASFMFFIIIGLVMCTANFM